MLAQRHERDEIQFAEEEQVDAVKQQEDKLST